MLIPAPLFHNGSAGNGEGYITGVAPYGIVTVESAPALRWIELRHRVTRTVVGYARSADDGTYVFHGYDPAEEFDLIARDWSDTYNDIIQSRIKPYPYDLTTLTDLMTGGSGFLDGYVRVYGGLPGHTVAVVDGTAPTGTTFAVQMVQEDDGTATFAVVPDGTAAAGTWTWTLRVTAPNGTSKDIALAKTVT